jgi:hypothetical protein
MHFHVFKKSGHLLWNEKLKEGRKQSTTFTWNIATQKEFSEILSNMYIIHLVKALLFLVNFNQVRIQNFSCGAGLWGYI